MKSIIQSNKQECYMCGSTVWLECHHIFGGANRKISEQYGIKVSLCKWCHNEPPWGVHHNIDNNNKLKAKAQEIAMAHYGWSVEDFIKIFGKNYL